MTQRLKDLMIENHLFAIHKSNDTVISILELIVTNLQEWFRYSDDGWSDNQKDRLREKIKYKVKRIREQMVQDNELLKDGTRFTLVQERDSDCEEADTVNTILRKIERLRRQGRTRLIQKWVVAMTEEEAKTVWSTVGRRIK